jgi:hypothetical protein
MPSHQDRVKTAGLPEGYQFGDGRVGWLLRTDHSYAGQVGRFCNVLDRLCEQQGITANVIEGDHH